MSGAALLPHTVPQLFKESHTKQEFMVMQAWFLKVFEPLKTTGESLELPAEISKEARKCGHNVAGKLRLAH